MTCSRHYILCITHSRVTCTPTIHIFSSFQILEGLHEKKVSKVEEKSKADKRAVDFHTSINQPNVEALLESSDAPNSRKFFAEINENCIGFLKKILQPNYKAQQFQSFMKDSNIQNYNFACYFVCVWNMVSLSHRVRNTGWGCSKTGCWGRYLGLRETR